jgi:succinylarginine dihydrolase
MPSAHEINFDGIVGPTHNYAGLSYGNIASMSHRQAVSSPKRAALEGLAKMKFLMDLGVKQAVLPPHERPHLPTLRRLGFTGSDADVLEKAHRADPVLLASVCSASAMWTANAATVSPSPDTADGKVHFTPANLISQFHRSIETPTTTRILRTIFADESAFVVHDPLPPAIHFADEGAANHMRLCPSHGEAGVEVFVFGRIAFSPDATGTARFPVRQTLDTSQAIQRSHLLEPARSLPLRQNPAAIDAGAFHNDVVAVANENVLLYHETAFAGPEKMMRDIMNHLYFVQAIKVPSDVVSIQDAVATYLFNSQIVTLPDGSMTLIAPIECRDHSSVRGFISEMISSAFSIHSVHYVDVRQSMHNGGGPACLRLRIVLNDEQITKMRGNVILTPALHDQLRAWIEKHYRDELRGDDLRDPHLIKEGRDALDELSRLLRLGPLYEFQQ